VPVGAAAAGRDGRRDRRRPLVGHHDAPRRGRPAERRRPARPRGRAPPGRDGPPLAPRRGRGTDPHACSPWERCSGVARVAREGVSIRDLVRIFEALSVRARRRPTSTVWSRRPARHWLRDQPALRLPRRAAARAHPRARLRAAAARGRPAERPGPGARARRRCHRRPRPRVQRHARGGRAVGPLPGPGVLAAGPRRASRA
jgi:hypothetical protein